ncbi:MAG TPA: asparagine synthase C-terminal domain-containing protein, partial [Allocoleopsis sp.]
MSKYYKINFIPENINYLEAQERVSKALKESIEYHFISDVPVGIFLSGGIDSSAVVALARKSQFGELRTYSIGFEESQWNEGEIAQKVAEKFDTKHTEYQITANIVKDLFPQFLQAIDQPSIDGFNTFCVSKIAHDDGIKVVLSGLGGDELFGGYASFYQIPKMVNFGQKFQLVKPVLSNIGKLLEYHSNNPKIKRLGDFFQQTPNTINAYRSFRGIFSHWEAINIIRKYLPEENIMRPNHISLSEKLPSIQDEISLLEITYYMRNQLLRDSDVMSMNWGLELRVPLVDRVLLETISSIPSNIRLKAGKELLVKSVPELPEFVYNRPKKGFIFPFEKWLNTELNDIFTGAKLNANIPVTSWYRKWSLGILEHWVKKQNM